jgi:hypothetical protein
MGRPVIEDDDFALLLPSFRAHGCTCTPSYVIDPDQEPVGDHGYVVHEQGCPLDRGDGLS